MSRVAENKATEKNKVAAMAEEAVALKAEIAEHKRQVSAKKEESEFPATLAKLRKQFDELAKQRAEL